MDKLKLLEQIEKNIKIRQENIESKEAKVNKNISEYTWGKFEGEIAGLMLAKEIIEEVK